jgi:hypothetical protein
MHKMAMLHTSKELHTMMSDAYTLYNEFAHGGVEMGYGMNKDGSYTEWMSNKSVRHVATELYTLAKDLRALMDSKMGRNQRRLEALTLNDKNFKSLAGHFMDDIDAHTWKEFEKRLEEVANMVMTKLMKCPHA